VAGYGILQSDDEEQQIRLYPDYLSDEERSNVKSIEESMGS